MSLKYGDLKNSISRDVSIDEYEPKSGKSEEIIVVGFYGSDTSPAEDLSDFITKGNAGIIDVDVSPNPNQDGYYLVFCEFPREPEFFTKFKKLLKDVQNVVGELDWRVSPYLTDDYHELDDPTWEQYVIAEPSEYVTKDEFDPSTLELDDTEMQTESLQTFFEDTAYRVASFDGKRVVLQGRHRQVVANVLDYGSYDDVKARHAKEIHESRMVLESNVEIRSLEQTLKGTMDTIHLESCFVVTNHNGEMLLLTDIEYG